MTRAFTLLTLLMFAAIPPRVAPQGLGGDTAAVRLARAMIARMGGSERWARATTLYIVEEVHRADAITPYHSETWRSLGAPVIWYKGRSGGVERRFARTDTSGWDKTAGTLRQLTDSERARWVDYWPRNVYTMYARLARAEPRLFVELVRPRRFAVRDAESRATLGEFEVAENGDVVRWMTSSNGESEEWVYGPSVAFGPVRMPAWGARLSDNYRFYYREVTLGQSEIPVSLEPPPKL